ncbi:hypothetical protein FRC17_002813, partial [Serendipita sp. 399]
AQYGCQFHGTPAQIDHHTQDCLNLLIAELLERQRRLSLQNCAPLTPPTSQARSLENSSDTCHTSDSGSMISMSHHGDSIPREPLRTLLARIPSPPCASPSPRIIKCESPNTSLGYAPCPTPPNDPCWHLDRSPPTARPLPKRRCASCDENGQPKGEESTVDEPDDAPMDPIEDSDRDEPMWDESDNRVERFLNSLTPWTHQPISPKYDAENLGLELGQVRESTGNIAPPMANGRRPATFSGESLATGLPPWVRSGSSPPSPSHNHGLKHSTQPEMQFTNDHTQRVLEDDDLMMRNCSMRRYQESLSPSFPDCKPDLWNVIRASTSGDTAMSSRRPPTLKTESKRGQRPLRSYRSMGTLTLNSSASSQHGRGPGPIRNVGHRRNVAVSISRGKHSEAFDRLSSHPDDQPPPLSLVSTHVHPQPSFLNAFNDHPVPPMRLLDDTASRMSRPTATSSLCNRVKSALVAALHPIGRGRELETGEPTGNPVTFTKTRIDTHSRKGTLEVFPRSWTAGQIA